jgi:hypothetical protein
VHEDTTALPLGVNSYDALGRRMDAATLNWRGPALMLFARSVCAVAAPALVAAVFAVRAAPTPWHDAEPWFPVYGTLIDAGCLTLLWRLTRREGIGLFDLAGFERSRFVRDVLLGVALIPVYLAFILSGVYAAGWLVYRTLTPPFLFAPLPLPAALYGVLVFPFIWGLTEQMTFQFSAGAPAWRSPASRSPGRSSMRSCHSPSMRSSWPSGCCRRCHRPSSPRCCICDFAG